ncbi:hypothetical protein [Achromobacter deleyi]|uniref:hypothetical protein n=1 Tax=Achromobacter deleyi TaxID=1353891 RepID=UPI001467CBC1|nr:hypothetical protein [Achromobacter deleyi]CAB3909749.1 hypothetical protein LMG3412_04676 [Achromobacter deleyi]
MLKNTPDPAATKPAPAAEKPPPVDPRKGTGILPMPDQSETVAGMPRRGRAIEEPGDPGIITPEDDVLDTSYENRKG